MNKILLIIFISIFISCNANDKDENTNLSPNNTSNANVIKEEQQNLDENDLNKIMIGEWIVNIVVARYPQFMTFLPDGNFLFCTESFNSTNDILGCTGKWKLVKNELFILPINELSYEKLIKYENGMEAGTIGPQDDVINIRKYENIDWFKINISIAEGFKDSLSEGYFRYFTVSNKGDFKSPFATEQISARRYLAMDKPVNTQELIKYAK